MKNNRQIAFKQYFENYAWYFVQLKSSKKAFSASKVLESSFDSKACFCYSVSGFLTSL